MCRESSLLLLRFEITLDFFDKSRRRSSRPKVNYSELEPKTTRRSKTVDTEKPKTKQMLSFEAYWRILTNEKNVRI